MASTFEKLPTRKFSSFLCLCRRGIKKTMINSELATVAPNLFTIYLCRFTESYGVIFQCNVKYCLGPCPPVSFKKNIKKRTFP